MVESTHFVVRFYLINFGRQWHENSRIQGPRNDGWHRCIAPMNFCGVDARFFEILIYCFLIIYFRNVKDFDSMEMKYILYFFVDWFVCWGSKWKLARMVWKSLRGPWTERNLLNALKSHVHLKQFCRDSTYLTFCGLVHQECDLAVWNFCVDPSKATAVIKDMVARVDKKRTKN